MRYPWKAALAALPLMLVACSGMQTAPPQGWPSGTQPTTAAGTQVNAFARDLDHPRWLYVLPNGDVLVAESSPPPMPQEKSSVASANRITLLRDTDGDGVADLRTVLLEGLNAPFGMALVGNALYVANTDAVVRFPYTAGDTRIRATGTSLVALPGGPLHGHGTHNLIASADGKKLYVTVGSHSPVAEAGMDAEARRAAVWEVDTRTGASRVFASSLRNPVGLAWEPRTAALWTVVHAQDGPGNDLVPDSMMSLRDGAFYGGPASYLGPHADARGQPQRPDLVAKAAAPDYALGAHTGAIGLATSFGASLPPFGDGMFVGQHGSWNRKPYAGYKVIFVPFAAGKPSGAPSVDVLTGFLGPNAEVYGRPAGVAVDLQGALLVADDVGNVVWRVSARR